MNRTVSYEDPDLIPLLLKKDPAACHWLYEKYAGALYTFISQVIAEPSERNEMLREVFVTICNTIVAYDPSRNRFFTWMLGIARQVVLRESKLQLKKPKQNGETGLGKWISRLNPEEKNLLELSWFQGYTHEEMARQLNISTEMARSRLRNTLSRLNKPS